MVVANTIHASSPASTGIIKYPAEMVRESAPAQARVVAIFAAINRSCRVGPGMTRSTAQKARIKRQTAAKSQMSRVTCNHTPKTPGLPGSLLSRITVLKWRTGAYQTSFNSHMQGDIFPRDTINDLITVRRTRRLLFYRTNANRCGNAPVLSR